MTILVWIAVPLLCCSATMRHAFADTLATASLDTGSYIYFGVDYGGTDNFLIATDYSMGNHVLDAHGNPAHFLFGVIVFDVSGLTAAGDKYLTITSSSVPGPSTIAVSVAQADIMTDYPWPGGPTNAAARLQWYQDNIKGDNAAYGGYAGGAPHVGVIEVPTPGSYSIDVTDEVNSWISGTPNYGFGLWGVSVGNVMLQETMQIATIENPNGLGPRLTSAPVPEPTNMMLAFVGLLGCSLIGGSKIKDRYR